MHISADEPITTSVSSREIVRLVPANHSEVLEYSIDVIELGLAQDFIIRAVAVNREGCVVAFVVTVYSYQVGLWGYLLIFIIAFRIVVRRRTSCNKRE